MWWGIQVKVIRKILRISPGSQECFDLAPKLIFESISKTWNIRYIQEIKKREGMWVHWCGLSGEHWRMGQCNSVTLSLQFPPLPFFLSLFASSSATAHLTFFICSHLADSIHQTDKKISTCFCWKVFYFSDVLLIESPLYMIKRRGQRKVNSRGIWAGENRPPPISHSKLWV